MKGTKRIVMMLLAAASMAQGATPYYAVRSQSVDSARELVGLVDILHRYDPSSCEPFSNFAVTFEYTRSFRAHDIARCLFGDGCLLLHIVTLNLVQGLSAFLGTPELVQGHCYHSAAGSVRNTSAISSSKGCKCSVCFP